MLQSCRELCLASKPLDADRLGDLRAENFEHHLTTEGAVGREEYSSHSSTAELAVE